MAIHDGFFLSIIVFMLPSVIYFLIPVFMPKYPQPSVIYFLIPVFPPKYPQLAPWANCKTVLLDRARYFPAAETARADMHMPG